MPRIEVLPEQLQTAGSHQLTIAAELRSVAGRLPSVGGAAADAAGDARAGAAMADCAQHLSGTLVALADAVDGCGANMSAAAMAYAATDAGAMPGPEGDR